MLNNHTKAINGPGQTAPVQTPMEFARATERGLRLLNQQLETLRGRLFGDEYPANPPDSLVETEREPDMLKTVASAHFLMETAMKQISEIHNRL